MQDQQQQLVQSLINLLEQADLVAGKVLVALGFLCKADRSLLGAVINPQLLQQVRNLITLSKLLIIQYVWQTSQCLHVQLLRYVLAQILPLLTLICFDLDAA